jgi:3-keto steroid reductase
MQARWFGSLHHNITAWNGAAAAVYVCLAPLTFIPIFLSAKGTPVTQGDEEKDGLLPLRLHSITDRIGRNTTATTPFYEWAEYEKDASRLVDRCERLYQSFVTAGGKVLTTA